MKYYFLIFSKIFIYQSQKLGPPTFFWACAIAHIIPAKGLACTGRTPLLRSASRHPQPKPPEQGVRRSSASPSKHEAAAIAVPGAASRAQCSHVEPLPRRRLPGAAFFVQPRQAHVRPC
jgi:hypothetical protein